MVCWPWARHGPTGGELVQIQLRPRRQGNLGRPETPPLPLGIMSSGEFTPTAGPCRAASTHQRSVWEWLRGYNIYQR